MRSFLLLLVVVALAGCASPTSGFRGSPEAPEAPVPVMHGPRAPTPKDPKALTYLVEVEGLALFSDERAEAEELLAAWAADQGLSVVPVARANEVFERARLGQHVDSGAACGAPLARWRAKRQWRSALGAEGVLRASVLCDDEPDACRLLVSAYDRVDWDGEPLLERTASFDRAKPWQESLVAAIAALAPPSDDEGGAGGLGGIFGMMGGGVVEAKPERLSFNAWKARATDRFEKDAFEGALSFPKGERPLRACFGQVTDGADLLVDVDARGRVARCESREAEDEVSRCVCEAFEKHASAKPALRSRRAHLGVHFAPADTVARGEGLVNAYVDTHLETSRDRRGQMIFRPSVSDPSVAEWTPPAGDAFERCFLDLEVPSELVARATVRFDAKGDAASVDVQAADGALSEAQRACVTKALASARAPCPAVPDAVARADVRVTVRRLGEPLPNPFESVGKGTKGKSDESEKTTPRDE